MVSAGGALVREMAMDIVTRPVVNVEFVGRDLVRFIEYACRFLRKSEYPVPNLAL